MNVHEKLLAVQTELKAPKGQYNSFGKYNYRSCEDILEAVKPHLAKVKATLVISDKPVMVGDWHYIEATARFTDVESGESIENTASARESATKKGMDDSQITGTASSYARKYALNGLFSIDDTKDADTDNYRNQIDNAPTPPAPPICPKCGQPVKAVRMPDNTVVSPAEVLKKKGMCYACSKAQKGRNKNA